MHQKEDLVAKAGPALEIPLLRETVVLLLRAYGKKGVVGAVNKASPMLKLEHAMAASLRYAAVLARDFPEAFQQLVQNDKIESERIIMSEQPVLTANEYVYTGRRFFFMWGDWPCELTVPQDQTSYKNNCIRDRARINARRNCNFFGDLTGFSAIISFPPRTIGELEARLHTMMQVGNRFVLDSLHVHSFLEFVDDPDHPDQRIGGREGIHALWLALQERKSTTAFFKFHDVKLSRLKIGFRFGHHYMPDDNLDLLYDDTFRTDLMLAHLRHYFGIPTAPINYYVPEPKEEVAATVATKSSGVTNEQMQGLDDALSRSSGNRAARQIVAWLLKRTARLTTPVRTVIEFNDGDTCDDACIEGLRSFIEGERAVVPVNSILQAMGSSFRLSFYGGKASAGQGKYCLSLLIADPEGENEAVIQKFEA